MTIEFQEMLPANLNFLNPEKGEMRPGLIQKFHEAGILNLVVPEEYDGPGLDALSIALIYEELGKGCAGIATSAAANALASYPVVVAGTEEQKRKMFDTINDGKLAAFALTMKARARQRRFFNKRVKPNITVLEKVSFSREELDEYISRFSKDWMIDRIARVDLSILRLAIYELRYRTEDVPTGAAINEAVELAKRYGGERSFAFVNGILGSVAKELVSP